MKPLVQLPKTARITFGGVVSLEINNHVVMYATGLFAWLIHWIKIRHEWDNMLPQMIQQGFKLDAVIEECLADVNNQPKFLWILYKLGKSRHSYEKLKKIISTGQAKQVQREITARLKACQNWDQLFHAVNGNDDLVKKTFKEWKV